MKHKTTSSHYEKCARFYAVAPEAFKAMALSILRGQTDADPVEYLRVSYENDPNLNNTFRGRSYYRYGQFANYDVHFPTVQRLLKGTYSPTAGLSLADSVSTIKHAMIYGILGCEPEFTEYAHVTSTAPADGVSGD